jgi:hypothetical protein
MTDFTSTAAGLMAASVAARSTPPSSSRPCPDVPQASATAAIHGPQRPMTTPAEPYHPPMVGGRRVLPKLAVISCSWSVLGPHGVGNRWSAAGTSGHDGQGETAGRPRSPADDLSWGSQTTAGSNPSASAFMVTVLSSSGSGSVAPTFPTTGGGGGGRVGSVVDRARRGASGALYPQAALAGLNPCPRVRVRRERRARSVDGQVPRNVTL